MATSPPGIKLVQKTRSADAFVQELTGQVSEAEQLKLLMKGYSECNPDPNDPNARTMASVFSSLFSDVDIRNALLPLRERQSGGDYGTRWWNQFNFHSEAVSGGDTDPDYKLSGLVNIDNIDINGMTDAAKLKFVNFGQGRDNGNATPPWDTLSTHFNAHWPILEGYKNQRLGITASGYYLIIGEINPEFYFPIDYEFSDPTMFKKPEIEMRVVMKRGQQYLDPTDVRVIGSRVFQWNQQRYSYPKLSFAAYFEGVPNDFLEIELQRSQPMNNLKLPYNEVYLDMVQILKQIDPYKPQIHDLSNFVTIVRIA